MRNNSLKKVVISVKMEGKKGRREGKEQDGDKSKEIFRQSGYTLVKEHYFVGADQRSMISDDTS